MMFSRPARTAALIGALALFAGWMVAHVGALTETQNGWIRFALSLAFAGLIVARPKPARGGAPEFGGAHEPVLAVIPGTACVIMGLIFKVGQVEWLGVLMMLWGCLRWALPLHYRRDVTHALLLLYWAHPLPTVLFGPLELGAQWLSVRGAESLLLGLDVRAWADGLVLHTGFRSFEVPAWCSGMRGATTVFLLAWGLAVLHRFRAVEAVVLVAAAVLQAMLLNVLRIALMVILVPRVVVGSEVEYLHNTGGLLVITTVFLVYAEARAWRRHQTRPAPVQPEDDRRLEHAEAWWHLRTARWAVAGGLTAVALVTAMLYRNGPENRLAVLKDVATTAQDAENFALALHLAHAVIAADPRDTDWQLKTLRLLLTLQRYDEVEAAAALSGLDARQGHERDILRAYALMATDRVDQAAALVARLPPEIRNANPRVAMIMAVVAFRAGDVAGVARHTQRAAHWKPNEARIRVMYPLLRTHREWEAIVATDSTTPHRQAEVAFAAIEAHMNMDQTLRVAQLTQDALATWPEDERLLEPLFYLALKRPDGPWEARFAAHFRRSVKALNDPDACYPMYAKVFEFGRPDLAWLLHRRLRELDPEHPALDMAVVRHGDRWFQVRRRTLGLPAPASASTIDLRALAMLAESFGIWSPIRDWIPEWRTLAITDAMPARQAALTRALAGFAARRVEGRLTIPMHYLYAQALELGGQGDTARHELELLAENNPAEADRVRLAISEIAERAGLWQEVYETLRGVTTESDAALPALLRLARAQQNLRLSLGAIETARVAGQRYPFAALADSMLAASLMQHGAPDEALHLIDAPRTRHVRELDVLRAQALYLTQRYQEVENFCQRVLLPRPPIHAESAQRFLLPPAELSLLWHRMALPSAAGFARNAEVLRQNRPGTTSPFLQSLMDLWLTCYAGGATTNATPVSAWLAAGRDPVEQATALNQFTLLLCSSGHYADAAVLARQATRLLPASGTLWRWAVSLADADADLLAEARRTCPADPELWLADLVQAVDHDPERVATVLKHALTPQGPAYPAEALTRAGEFLSRRELHEEARTLLHAAQGRAVGLLPTHIQALRAALLARDAPWAVESAQAAILAALRPPSTLYRKLVEIKMAGEEPETDFDMVEALKNLRVAEPDNLFWAQVLGYVRFKRGGWEIMDALTQMNVAIGGGITNRLAFSVAAEAARMLENYERSAEILREGLRYHPDDLPMLNNLAYVLTLAPGREAEAEALVPMLLERGREDPRVLDTVAAVYTQRGRFDEANAAIAQQAALVAAGTPLWFRARTYEARALAAQGAAQAATTLLESALRDARELSDEDVVNANRLLTRWREAQELMRATSAPPVAVDAEAFSLPTEESDRPPP